MPAATGVLGVCDMCGGYMQGNGKGYCANSRSRPLICQGDSGQTRLLCGRVKGGERGCWGRGCRSGEAPESVTEAALRNRASNVRSAHRKLARDWNKARLLSEAQEAEAFRKQGEESARGGLRSCLRRPGQKRELEEKRVLWGQAPCRRYTTASTKVPKKAYGTQELRNTLWWAEAGKKVECEGCGGRFDRDDAPLQPEPGRSQFCSTAAFCEQCRPKDFCGGNKKGITLAF